MPPKVSVAPDSASKRAIRLLTHPDEKEAALWQPGACFVVRASAPGRLVVEVSAASGGGSTAASIQVESLTQGAAQANSRPAAVESAPLDLASFRLVGHVAGIGDVRVNPGQWLAGPSAPSRIEGITLEWPGKPADLTLRYSVTTARPQPISQRLMELGGYAGTRGRALALVGLTLELSGRAVSTLGFNVEATFLGAPAIRRAGPRISLSGPTGREPLVGLKIGLETAHPRSPAQARTSPESTASGVRVFRSRAKADQAAVV